jgi:KipI family sensor histidine kinase inhibitor
VTGATGTAASGAPTRIVPFGERAWLLDLGDVIDEAVNARVIAIAAAIEDRRRAGVEGLERPVVAYASLLLAFDPSRIAADDARRLLVDAADAVETAVGWAREPAALERPPVEIPVHYGGLDGPDLGEVANRLGLAPDAVVRLHSGTTYRVFMLGFAPGFAYLGTLPAELSLPRRAEPRTSVPAGSVAIAARQTAVYPVATPGGWHLIGRTDAILWDPSSDSPARLAPGDHVRFVAC